MSAFELLNHKLLKAVVFSLCFLLCLDNEVFLAIFIAFLYWGLVAILQENDDETK